MGLALHTVLLIKMPVQFKKRRDHTGVAADPWKTGSSSSANRNNTSYLSGLPKRNNDDGDVVFRKGTAGCGVTSVYCWIIFERFGSSQILVSATSGMLLPKGDKNIKKQACLSLKISILIHRIHEHR